MAIKFDGLEDGMDFSWEKIIILSIKIMTHVFLSYSFYHG